MPTRSFILYLLLRPTCCYLRAVARRAGAEYRAQID
jgi:hypothetical protein